MAVATITENLYNGEWFVFYNGKKYVPADENKLDIDSIDKDLIIKDLEGAEYVCNHKTIEALISEELLVCA